MAPLSSAGAIGTIKIGIVFPSEDRAHGERWFFDKQMIELKMKRSWNGPYGPTKTWLKTSDGKRTKRVYVENMDLALGLVLVANKELISEEGSDFRHLLDTAASLDIPGLEALGQGIRHSLSWTKVHLTGWKLPKFCGEEACQETSKDWPVVQQTTQSLLQSKCVSYRYYS